ncbi:hypothetical protein PoB_004155000 [Plakobranchus ocellatus]|uniref:Endonuclease/exonuclease/phosphatase domain-containing protein n=1 Tax=Plakobranchus ocellatus TaxID=259542 RepID=A0AAV4B7G9_9GAST|nr:hypothetical protein PoB_004155000 [Plakobranchus ocellatus]
MDICGFWSNFEELKPRLNQSQLAVVALQECRLGEGQSLPWDYRLLLLRGESSQGGTSHQKRADWTFFGDLCGLSLENSVANVHLKARLSIPFHK